MSSTYVSNFYAAALRRTHGYAYVMYFETCESNVFPRTPRWRAQYVGSLPEVLGQLVEYVDCCDGGMTKGAHGCPISSASFVRRCEAQVRAQQQQALPLKWEGGSFTAAGLPLVIAQMNFQQPSVAACAPYHETALLTVAGLVLKDVTAEQGPPYTATSLPALRMWLRPTETDSLRQLPKDS